MRNFTYFYQTTQDSTVLKVIAQLFGTTVEELLASFGDEVRGRWGLSVPFDINLVNSLFSNKLRLLTQLDNGFLNPIF